MIRVATINITRPSNALAYNVGDRIWNSTTVTGITTAGAVFANLGETMFGNGYVTKAKIFVSTSGITAGLRLHLYTLASGEALATGTTVEDNVAMGVALADSAKYEGYIDFTTWVNGTNCSFSIVDDIRLCFQRATIRGELANAGTLVGILEARTGFTPTSAQTFQIELMSDAYEG
jgi:hypothetical protein